MGVISRNLIADTRVQMFNASSPNENVKGTIQEADSDGILLRSDEGVLIFYPMGRLDGVILL